MHLPCRREALWPELDKILRDEDDKNTVSTPYTAAILEYRVIIHGSGVATFENQYNNLANGNSSFDIHHPCRYVLAALLSMNFTQTVMKSSCSSQFGLSFPLFIMHRSLVVYGFMPSI